MRCDTIRYDTKRNEDIKSLIYKRSLGRILISALFLAAGVYFHARLKYSSFGGYKPGNFCVTQNTAIFTQIMSNSDSQAIVLATTAYYYFYYTYTYIQTFYLMKMYTVEPVMEQTLASLPLLLTFKMIRCVKI